MIIPGLAAEEELDEPDAALHQSPRDQAARAVLPRVVLVESVEPSDRLGLARDVECFLGGRLHGRGQLVALDPGLEVGLARMLILVSPVETVQEREVLLLQASRAGAAAGRG